MNWRGLLVFIYDICAVAAAWWSAYLLRFNLELTNEIAGQAAASLRWSLPVYVVIFYSLGLYRGLWRYASLGDLHRIAMAVSGGGILVTVLVHLAGLAGVPRSVLIVHPLLLLIFLGGGRFLYRAWRDGYFPMRERSVRKSVLVLGAGDAAAMLVRDLVKSPNWRVVGLLDNDVGKHGRYIGPVPVLGTISEVANHAERLGVQSVIIAMPSASAGQRRMAMEAASVAGLTVFTVPALEDILKGHVSISHVRPVELEDLLGREPVQLDDRGLMDQIGGNVILVTGAGGSIGSELCRQILRFSPRLLVLYEQSELALYSIEQEFAGRSVACVIGDVKDEAMLSATFGKYCPHVVFHAAAYKHVPLMEGDNAWQAVRNNVLGTWRVALAAVRFGAREFVLISTDKAVNPTNVMGASKRVAERLCEALQSEAGDTRFVMVRFGNVLGSSGSVIPKFRAQIARGGPVTVTHPEIVRYFMLIPEAAQLVLQAALQARTTAEGGVTYVLDMGEPVKIADLARDLIRLSGLSEHDIRIEYTGLRPGEKLYEELLADGETTLPTPHPKLRLMKAEAAPDSAWLRSLAQWLEVLVRPVDDVKRGLHERVPEYHSSEP
jgi:FlaA1/EpsC-like NDP-sugar epimerase